MINLHYLGVKFVSKAQNEYIRHTQMLCNFTHNNLLDLSQTKTTTLGLSDPVELDLRMQIFIHVCSI